MSLLHTGAEGSSGLAPHNELLGLPLFPGRRSSAFGPGWWQKIQSPFSGSSALKPGGHMTRQARGWLLQGDFRLCDVTDILKNVKMGLKRE